MGLIQPAAFQGDRAPGSIVRFKFAVNDATGAMASLGGTPALSVYRDGNSTESISGVTLTVDFDSLTGLCDVAIDTSSDAGFYAGGSDYEVVITTGTVGAVNVVGSPVGHFSLSKCTATLTDGVAHGGTPGSSTATFAMAGFNITAPTNEAVVIQGGSAAGTGLLISSGTDGNALVIQSDSAAVYVTTTAGPAIRLNPTDGEGIYIHGSLSNNLGADAIKVIGVGSGNGFRAQSAQNNGTGNGMVLDGGKYGGAGLLINTLVGDAILLNPTDGNGITIAPIVNQNPAADGINISGAGTGHDINLVGDGKFWDNINSVPVGISLDLTQMIPTSNTDQSLGDTLNAARAQGFGKWVRTGTTLDIYASDGTTIVHSFTLDDATAPTQRV